MICCELASPPLSACCLVPCVHHRLSSCDAVSQLLHFFNPPLARLHPRRLRVLAPPLQQQEEASAGAAAGAAVSGSSRSGLATPAGSAPTPRGPASAAGAAPGGSAAATNGTKKVRAALVYDERHGSLCTNNNRITAHADSGLFPTTTQLFPPTLLLSSTTHPPPQVGSTHHALAHAPPPGQHTHR